MEERGLVLKVNKKTCLVLTPDGQFKEIALPSKGAVAGCEVSWRARHSLANFLGYLRPLAAAAALCVFLLAGQWLYVLASTAAYFTLDINPSIELALACDGRVLTARGLNPDGKKLLKGMKLKGQTLDAAAGSIVAKTASSNYFNGGEGGVILGTLTVKEGRALAFEPQSAARVLESAAAGAGVSAEVVVCEVTPPLRREAFKAGLSPGRYLLVQAASQKGINLDPKEVSSSSLSHIVKKQKMSLHQLMDTGESRSEGGQDGGESGAKPGRGNGARQEEETPDQKIEIDRVKGAGKRTGLGEEPGPKTGESDTGRAGGKQDLPGRNAGSNGLGKKN